MGKTVQMISVLVSEKLDRSTLVICPVVAMIQWKEEIEKYTQAGSIRILIFHGTFAVINSSLLNA